MKDNSENKNRGTGTLEEGGLGFRQDIRSRNSSAINTSTSFSASTRAPSRAHMYIVMADGGITPLSLSCVVVEEEGNK